jgi:hypothetical protein
VQQTLPKQEQENQPAISGLEKAIIFIAFIVIAATFTYTFATNGLFSAGQNPEPEATRIMTSGGE